MATDDTKAKRVRTALRLHPDLLERLDREAEERLLSRNRLIELAVERLVDDFDGDQYQPTRETR